MQRIMMDRLIAWKDDPNRKPLLLQGIRRCGKTYLLKEFGSKHFKSVIYCDFEEDKSLADLFGQDFEPLRIIKNLSIYFEMDVRPGETLIIFDEIQNCDNAFNALGHFDDIASEYHVAAAGSYINAAMKSGASIHTSAVAEMILFPMNFYEYLMAQNPMLALHLKESAFKNDALKTFKSTLEEKYRDFQLVGGMPEVVFSWIETKSIETVERLQLQAIRGIENDFTRYAPISLFPKLCAIWNAIPGQLAKGNRKFMFSRVKHSWRAKDLEDALYWLVRAGLVYKVEHTPKPEFPLSALSNYTHFKLYMCDVGLLRRTGQIPASVILDKTGNFKDIKGSLAENVVCCELKRIYEQDLYYWSAEKPGKAEVEFIVQDGEDIVPIEVKAGGAGRARSLIQYRNRFSPKKWVLTSMDNDKEGVLPLYVFWNMKEWLRIFLTTP